MSRVGRLPIKIPAGITITVNKQVVTVKGPKGTLSQEIDPDITVQIEDGSVQVSRPTDHKRHRSLHGLYRVLINNMIKGVSTGYEQTMELIGVGYKATHKGTNQLELSMGFSHSVVWIMPPEITVETVTNKGENPKIILKGIDKQLLGQVAAKVRDLRSPEPYKGKGIRYLGESVRRKAGKTSGKKK